MKMIAFCLAVLSTIALNAQVLPVPAHQDGDITKKMGYKNPETGKWVIPPTFDYAKPFGPKKLAVVFRNGKAGFIDIKGHMLINPQFDDAETFNEDGIAIVRKVGNNYKRDGHQPVKDRFGAIDMTGKLVVPYIFQELNDRSFPGTLIGKKDYRWGIISTEAVVLLPFEYNMITVHKSLRAAIVRQDSLLGVINPQCEFTVEMADNMARFAGDGMISLYKDGKFGYCNLDGKMVIPYEFHKYSIFREGLCLVRRNKFYGFIDTTGKTAIPFEYTGGEPFTNDTAIMIKPGGKMGLINKKNEVLLDFTYDYISRYYFPRPPGGMVLVRDTVWYYLDPNTGEPTIWNEIDLDDPNLNREKEEKDK